MLGRLLGERRTRLAHARRVFFEGLEDRCLLASVPIAWGDMSGNNTITVEAIGPSLKVTVDGNPEPVFNGLPGNNDTLTIEAGEGTDTVNLVGLPPASAPGPAVVLEEESNDGFGSPQDVDGAGWNVLEDEEVETSTSIPHIRIEGNGLSESMTPSIDFYKFNLSIPEENEAPFKVIVDIDHTVNFDSVIEVYAKDVDDEGAPILLLGSNDDGEGGGAGSEPGSFDSYLQVDLNTPGNYIVWVRVGALGELDLAPVPINGQYVLQLSADGKSSAAGSISQIIVNGSGNDTLNVGAALMESVVRVGPSPFSGSLMDGNVPTLNYTGVETFNGGGTFNVQVDLADLSAADTIADTTYVRPDAGGSTLLIDFNGVTYFGGGLSQLSVIEIIGSSDNDTVTIENVIQNAIVYGNAGDDVIHSSAGTDSLFGGDGNDWITGGDGDDRIYGNAGNDQLGGNGGNDIVSGGTGDDQVVGQSGIDLLLGGDGADHVLGNNDRDLLFANGATRDSDPSHDGDALDIFDHDYHEMISLHGSWIGGNLGISGFVSNGNDGDVDRLQGGRDDDWFLYSAADGDLVIDNQDEIPPPQ